ncbi:MAG: type II toxin-antitoxin system PemK/MazF family toxin [Desulfovermiculus sp.]
MKRGEIRWYKFNKPDKKRPVLILTRNSVIEYLNEITIAPITSTVRDIPSEVFLSKEDGMPRECAVNCDHLQTVSKLDAGGHKVRPYGYDQGRGVVSPPMNIPGRRVQSRRGRACLCPCISPKITPAIQPQP